VKDYSVREKSTSTERNRRVVLDAAVCKGRLAVLIARVLEYQGSKRVSLPNTASCEILPIAAVC
jgi:hypothetical protein